jgi:hypothetical protein
LRWLSVAAAAIRASALDGSGCGPNRRRRRSSDLGLVEQQLGRAVELEADRSQILAQQEIHVLEGEAVRVLGLRTDRGLGGGLGFLARAGRCVWGIGSVMSALGPSIGLQMAVIGREAAG